MIFLKFILLLCSLSLYFSQYDTCTSGNSPTADELNKHKKFVDLLLELNKRNIELWSKCKGENFVAVSSINFDGERMKLEISENKSIGQFFDVVEESEILHSSCSTFRDEDDVLPKNSYVDQSNALRKLYDKNPIIYEQHLNAWAKALQSVKRYLTQCTKERIQDLEFFKKIGDVEDVFFSPKHSFNSQFSFVYDVLNENTPQMDLKKEEKLATPILIDHLKFVDIHYFSRVIVPPPDQDHDSYDSSDTGEAIKHTEDQGPHGFQLIFRKDNFNFKHLKEASVNVNLEGNLFLYIFDSHGKMKSMESRKNVRTNGLTLFKFTNLNIQLQDKDILLFDYEGTGAFAKTSQNLYSATKSVVMMNNYIKRNNFKNPKIGATFEIDKTDSTVDAIFVLGRKD